MNGFWAVFGDKNVQISHNILIINRLLKDSEISKKYVWRDFLSVFENFVLD